MSLNFTTIFRALLLICLLIGVGFIIQNSDLSAILSREWVDANVRYTGIYGLFLFFLLSMLLVTLGFPRQIISFFGGYAFGFLGGFYLALLSMVVGCIICFTVARSIGRDVVVKKFPSSIKKADSFLKHNTFMITLIIRLLPVGNNFATNLAAGISSAKPLPFFLGSTLGYIPQVIIFALLGSGITIEPEFRISLSIVLFIMSTILGLYLWRIHQKEK